LQLDEGTSTPWRVTTQENNVAIVNTYTVQPNGTIPTTPGPDAASPGDDDDDGDGLDQLSVKFSRSYHVNKSPGKKSPRKGSVQTQQGITPPASTTFSPPLQQGQFISPGEGVGDPFEYITQHQYEGLGIAPQGYGMTPIPQYVAANMHPGQQYMRSPGPMMATRPLQPLQGNPHIQRSPGRMMPVPAVFRPMSPVHPQVQFQPNIQMQQASPQRMVRQQTHPLPGQVVYDENTLMQAALISQIRQHQQQQQLQQQGYLSPTQFPPSPQRLPIPVSRSMPSSPEKRKYANQLAQVSELDLLSIPTPLVSSPIQSRQSKPQETQLEEPKSTHLRGISFLDELFESKSPTPKGPIAPDGTLREDDDEEDDGGYDDAALEADVNAWLENDNLEGTGWLDQVILN